MTTFMRAPGRRDWTLLAGLGLLVPALIAILRALVLRYTILRELHYGFVPRSGPINGIWPHPIYCLMHNLTHPVLLLLYATVLVWLPLYARGAILNRGLALFCGIASLHVLFVFSYCASIFLPVGDMVTSIRA